MNKSLWTSFALATITFSLTACSSMSKSPLPQSPSTPIPWQTRVATVSTIQSFHIQGKIGLQTARDSGSANVNWVQNGSSYNINLIAALGSHQINIAGHPGFVQVGMDGRTYTGSSPEQILAAHWHFAVPISNLYYWVRGLPAPGSASGKQFDSSGRLVSLTQQGWNVQFLSYTRYGNADLPTKIIFNSASLRAKLLVYGW